MNPKYKSPARIPLAKRDWIERELTAAPIWCSVDLRDGNQALPMPMNPAKKLEYFKLLADIGFREIEVAFPSASQDDFDFTRELIEGNHIPDGVRISVLTQMRENLIRRTVESLKGVGRRLFMRIWRPPICMAGSSSTSPGKNSKKWRWKEPDWSSISSKRPA